MNYPCLRKTKGNTIWCFVDQWKAVCVQEGWVSEYKFGDILDFSKVKQEGLGAEDPRLFDPEEVYKK